MRKRIVLVLTVFLLNGAFNDTFAQFDGIGELMNNTQKMASDMYSSVKNKKRKKSKNKQFASQEMNMVSRIQLAEDLVPDNQVTLNNGTSIPLQALSQLAVSDANQGQLIDFQVTDDVMCNGMIAIPRGCIAKIEVYSVNRGGSFQDESMELTPRYVLLPNGEKVEMAQKIFLITGASSENIKAMMFGKARGVMNAGYSMLANVSSPVSVTGYRIGSGLEASYNQRPSIICNTDINSPITANSDVDSNIPNGKSSAENTFAVIIANENYASEVKVQYAINDGRAFKEYCRKTLGLPDLNIHYCENATKNNIVAEIDWVTKVADAFGNDAKIIVYYAGHGIPDDNSKTPYLLPIDGFGTNSNTGYSLNELYDQLSALPASHVTVLIDACFSGTRRGEGMIVDDARGVRIKPKSTKPRGNLVVLSAVTGEETAYPYKEKEHGLFTYFLLKKLQDSRGECSLQDLYDYVKTQVSRRSILVNGKSQTPTMEASSTIANNLKAIKLR